MAIFCFTNRGGTVEVENIYIHTSVDTKWAGKGDNTIVTASFEVDKIVFVEKDNTVVYRCRENFKLSLKLAAHTKDWLHSSDYQIIQPPKDKYSYALYPVKWLPNDPPQNTIHMHLVKLFMIKTNVLLDKYANI